VRVPTKLTKSLEFELSSSLSEALILSAHQKKITAHLKTR